MGRVDYRRCRQCGRPANEVGELSHIRLCEDCGTLNLAENVLGIHLKTGEPWRRWRRAMAACVGGVLLDETAGKGQTEAR